QRVDCLILQVLLSPFQMLILAQLGGSVILECHMPTPSTYTYIWIKLTPGKAPDIIAFWSNLYNKDVAFKENGNVKYEVMKSSSSFNLSITHLDASALGTYYCGVVTNQLISSSFLHPSDPLLHFFRRHLFALKLIKSVFVLQLLSTFSLIFHLSWHLSIQSTIRSTHENKRTCESQECVYSLQKKNFSFQDMGTYYCALVTCGEVILGNGTEFTGKLTHNYRYHNHHVGKMLANSILYTLNLLIKQTPGSCIVFVFGKFRKYMLLII
uniref:Ig-like domain-containing protein n=1 Tax=Erpetoichthys calabaricus TaxID=27687 RepID=A0A8C4SNG1_ERPCA